MSTRSSQMHVDPIFGRGDTPWLWREARYWTLRQPDRIFHAGPNRRFPPWRIANEVR